MKPSTDQLPLRAAPQPRKPAAPLYSAPYYEQLPTPPTTPDLHAAKVYLAAVRDLLAFDLSLPKSKRMARAARSVLQRIERRWAKRAAGKDPRWAVMGSRAGRLTQSDAEQVRGPEPTAWNSTD
jgi:hypothetical protein